MSPSIIVRIADTPSPDVSVLVPALNEQDTIREVIERLLAVPLKLEIIVINDGSNDGTAAILADYEEQIKVVTHAAKSGKGRAIRSGLEVATGRVAVIQDADLEYFPEELPMLVEPILAGDAHVVYGTRFAAGFPKGMALPNKIVNWGLALATRILYGQKITDEATCYKAAETSLLKSLDLQCTGFEFCPEVTAKVSRVGERIREIPIRYIPRNKQAGKKIRWTDAPIAFWTLLKYRFWRR